jgi:AbrB family looped-hinge helix DNA binding protein
MNTVTLSADFQVVIPHAIREALHLKAGDKLQARCVAGRVEFIPVRPIQPTLDHLRCEAAQGKREDFERFLAAVPHLEPGETDRLPE